MRKMNLALLTPIMLFVAACAPMKGAGVNNNSKLSFAKPDRWTAIFHNFDQETRNTEYSTIETEESIWISVIVAGTKDTYIQMDCAGQDTDGPGKDIGYSLLFSKKSFPSDRFVEDAPRIRAVVKSGARTIYDKRVKVAEKDGSVVPFNGAYSFFAPRDLSLAIRRGTGLTLSLPESGGYDFTLKGSTAATDVAGCHVISPT